MVVTHKLKMDLEGKTPAPWVEVKQWDTYTREVRFQMFSKNDPWEIPENVKILICYRKPDEKYGEYDTLPNGETAWKAEGNALCVTLTPQMLTTPGKVSLQICMIQEERILHSFPVEIYVRSADKGIKGIASDDYYFMTGVLSAPVQAEIGQFIRVLEVDGRGRVLRVEAVEAPDSGAVSEQQVQGIVEDYLKENPPASGKDGISPEAKIVQTETGAVITLTDQEGTTTATIANGKDGADGAKGEKGDTGEKGETGDPGVYVLSDGETIADAPADAEVVIDPNGEVPEVITAPKTAAVGQTIVVKAVDANGRPMEWEAADFPEGGGASGWEDLGSDFEEGAVLAETAMTASEEMGMGVLPHVLNISSGMEYTVVYNGTEYKCVCAEYVENGMTALTIGNNAAIGGDDTGEPFIIMSFPAEAAESMGVPGGIIPLDGSMDFTISITGPMETVVPIPAKYLPGNIEVYEIELTAEEVNSLLTVTAEVERQESYVPILNMINNGGRVVALFKNDSTTVRLDAVMYYFDPSYGLTITFHKGVMKFLSGS